MNTTIIIPGRETQTIPGLVMTKQAVVASFAGTVDLSGMESSETREGDDVTFTFKNRTGTKGSGMSVNIENLNVNVDGDLVVNSTRIEVPGREAQVLDGYVMSADEVISAFAGSVNLSGMDHTEEDVDGVRVVSFKNRTGTKGSTVNINDIFAALQGSQNEAIASSDEIEEEEEDEVELANTRITIPGRQDQVITGMVMDSQIIKESFAGTIDLSGYDVEETENGDTLEVRFSARTGTKG